MNTTIPEIIHEKNSFGNAWYRALNHILKTKHEITFGGKVKDKVPVQYEKKKAYDSDTTIVLEGNALKEAIEGKLHPQFPTKEKVKEAYINEWNRGYDWRKQGFAYCYEDRAENYQGYKTKNIALQHSEFNMDQVPSINVNTIIPISIDQWKLAREDLAQQIETGIQSNRNVIVIGNPSIDRFEIPDSPPCLREIWIRWEREDMVAVETNWRSRDCYGALMTNIPGLLSAVVREVVIPNKCKIIQYVDKSNSLHIYSGDWESAAQVKPIQINPMLMNR